MTNGERVQGYLTEEEAAAAAEAQQELRLQEQEKQLQEAWAELRAKIESARKSTAPKNCMVEHIKIYKEAFSFSDKRNVAVDTFPAWHLGSWSIFVDQGSQAVLMDAHSIAVTSEGRFYDNQSGLGERKEFKIGEEIDLKSKYKRRILGSEITIPNDFVFFKHLISLQGWAEIEEGVPKPEENDTG
jgi:hypothetical protein